MPEPARHIVLVGMMGSGKSAVGALVAQRTGRHLVDIDAELEAEYDRTVHQLFAERGEEEFRELEAEAVERILPGRVPLVVATGGGAVLDPVNRAHIAEHANAVWLRVPPDVLAERLAVEVEVAGRPLLQGTTSVAEIGARLATLAAERDALYAEVGSAPHGATIDASGDPDAVADAVVAAAAGIDGPRS